MNLSAGALAQSTSVPPAGRIWTNTSCLSGFTSASPAFASSDLSLSRVVTPRGRRSPRVTVIVNACDCMQQAGSAKSVRPLRWSARQLPQISGGGGTGPVPRVVVVVEVAPGVVVVVGAGVVLEVVVGRPAVVVEVVDDAGVVVVDAPGALVDVVVLTGALEVVVVRGAAVVVVVCRVVVVAAGQPALKIRDLHEGWSFPCFTSSLVTWAAQLTYAPWLRAGQHWVCAAASASGTPRPLHAAAKPRSEAPRRTARARKPASPIRVPMKSPIRGVGGASFVSPGSWRAVRRGCSYARMRSDATSPRTPSARPVFPSPSCWSATRSISVVSLTVQGYFERWVAGKVPPEVRRAQANDYCRHMKGYVLPVLGDMPLEAVMARDILGLRTELRQRGLSLKYVKNILAGSFKAMLRDARLIDHALAADPFEGVTWPRVEVPEADPFTPEERQRILAWFRDKRFSFNAG